MLFLNEKNYRKRILLRMTNEGILGKLCYHTNELTNLSAQPPKIFLSKLMIPCTWQLFQVHQVRSLEVLINLQNT